MARGSGGGGSPQTETNHSKRKCTIRPFTQTKLPKQINKEQKKRLGRGVFSTGGIFWIPTALKFTYGFTERSLGNVIIDF